MAKHYGTLYRLQQTLASYMWVLKSVVFPVDNYVHTIFCKQLELQHEPFQTDIAALQLTVAIVSCISSVVSLTFLI